MWLLQQMGLRQAAGTAGAVEPVLDYLRTGRRGSPLDVARRSAEGAYRGVRHMEGPGGTPAETALPDMMRRQGFTEPIWRAIPGQKENVIGTGLAFGPRAAKTYVDVMEFGTGPEGASLATDVVVGDRISGAAGLVGKGLKAAGVQEGVSRVGDKLRQTKLIGEPMKAFSPMAGVQRKVVDPTTGRVLSENAREEIRQLMRERAGARGALESRFGLETMGGLEIIERGAKQFNMPPTERAKYLETVYENAKRTGRFTFDEAVRKGWVTSEEGDWLRRVMDYYEDTVPAARRAAGLTRGVLNEAAERAAVKFEDAMTRVTQLRDELEKMVQGRRDLYYLDHEGNPVVNRGSAVRIGFGEREGLRKDLIKAISDADYAARNFSRASRHYIKPAEFDRKNLWNYTIEELLEITENITQQEARQIGRLPFDRKMIPRIGDYKAVVRMQTNGRPQARVFDRYGNEVWRQSIESQNEVEALQDARRVFGPGVEFEIEKDSMWSLERDRVRGPRRSPIPMLRRIETEIRDRENYFLNYLPRYESEELRTLTAPMRRGKKSGVSTGIGGKRIAAPTTTQEEARALIRAKWVREAHRLDRKAEDLREPLQDMTEALSSHIRLNAGAVSSANFLHRVRQGFGVEARTVAQINALRAEGWRPLAELRGATSGMTPHMKDLYQHSFVPGSVFEGIQALNKALDPVERTGFQRFFHRVLQNEKIYLTLPNPRFTIRNRQWEVMASYMRGNRNIDNWYDADRLVGGYYHGKKVPGFDMTGEQLIAYLQREGVLGPDVGLSSQVSVRGRKLRDPFYEPFRSPRTAKRKVLEDYGGSFPDRPPTRDLGAVRRGLMESAAEALRKPVRLASELNQGGEARSRVAHWLWAMRDKKMDRVAARKEVGTTMFDYANDFYTVQEHQLKEWIPFYTWFRRIIPLSGRMLFERPGEFSKAGAIMTQVNAMNGVSPEEMEYLGRSYLTSMGIVLPDEPGQLPGTKRVLQVPFGLSDPSAFTQLSPEVEETTPGGRATGVIRGIAGAVRPSVQLPLSFIYAASPTGQKYSGETVKLPGMYLLMPEPVRERLGVTVVDGLPYGPSTLVPLARYLQGGWGEAAGGLVSTNPRQKERFAAWLSGLSVDPEVPMERNRMGQGIRAVKEVQDATSRLRQGANRMQQQLLNELLREEMRRGTAAPPDAP